MRYDLFISKKLHISRNKALELIHHKAISLNSKFFKASFDIQSYAAQNFNEIYNDEALLLQCEKLKLKLLKERIFVSRAALKLEAFLENVQLKLKDFNCLDIGSSTGGFVQVLLEKGARKVVALDVGHKQLAHNLQSDKRVISLEKTDLRSFESEEKFDLITCDLSFISLLKVLACINKLYFNKLILLFKPQFEVGKNAKRNKKGVLEDTQALKKAMKNFESACEALNWFKLEMQLSSLKGKEGNEEYFYLYEKR